MKRLSQNSRTLALVGALAPLVALFVYVALRSGPLAPVPVTIAVIENRSITPSIFGVGAIEARYTYKIGPTVAGRIKSVYVNVGDKVQAGQTLGEMDPVDFDDRIASQEAALKRAEAAVLVAEAQMQEASARKSYAQAQARRYEELGEDRWVSEEAVASKRQELQLASAGLAVASSSLNATRQDLSRIRSDYDGLRKQRANLRLVSPMDGLVAVRDVDPGATVVAGQSVVEVIDPASLWINTRFDQLRVSSLRAGLPVQIVLRSRDGRGFAGRVSRVEPMADVVTEETLAKVVFDSMPEPLPPIGELAEVTVALPASASTTVAPNASVKRVDGHLGVWVIENGALRFAPVKVGAVDLNGMAQILEGVKAGDRVVVYSQRAIDAQSRVKIVERLPGVSQ